MPAKLCSLSVSSSSVALYRTVFLIITIIDNDDVIIIMIIIIVIVLYVKNVFF